MVNIRNKKKKEKGFFLASPILTLATIATMLFVATPLSFQIAQQGEVAEAEPTALPAVVSEASPASVNPGENVQWNITPNNTTGESGLATLTGDIPDSAELSSVTASTGWSLEYSTDDGATWSPTAPADFADITNVRAVTNFPESPTAQSPVEALTTPTVLQLTGGGDGFNATFYKDTLWLANHHARAGDPTYGNWLKCFDKQTGNPCTGSVFTSGATYISPTAGEPFGQGIENLDTPNASVAYINQSTGRIYVPAQVAVGSGLSQVGWVCGDLDSLTSCGFTAVGSEEAPQDFGGVNLFTRFNPAQSLNPQPDSAKLYAIGGSGKIYCLDGATGNICAGSPTQSLTNPLSMFDFTHFILTAAVGETVNATDARYILAVSASTPTTWELQCRDLVADADCFTPITLANPFPSATSIGYSQPQALYDTSGNLEALCTMGAGDHTSPPVWACYNPDGTVNAAAETTMDSITPDAKATFSSRFQTAPTFDPNYVYSLMMYSRQIGERLYIPWVVWPTENPLDAYNTVTCFDYSTGAACAGFVPPEESYAENIVYTIEQDDADPRCLWWSGDRGRLQAFNANTGAEECPYSSLTQTPVAPESCAPLDAYSYTNITIPNLPAGASAVVRVYNNEGKIIDLPGGSAQTITDASGSVDISSLQISGTTSNINVDVQMLADTDIPMDGVSVVVGWESSGAAICAELTALSVCEPDGETPLNAELVVTTGSGPQTFNGTTSFAIVQGENDCVLNLTKTINGGEYPEAPGYRAAPTTPINYGFAVSTPGTFTLGGPVVTDDNTTTDPGDDFNPTYTGGDTNGNGKLDPGETWTYIYDTTAVAAPATVTNTATATAPGATNNPVTAVAVYTPEDNALTLVKTTNGKAQGGELVVGDDVTWAYSVTNTGPQEITNIVLEDDKEGTITCTETSLAPGAEVICSKDGIVGKGDYTNVATVTGTDPQGAEVTDQSNSNYIGLEPAITVRKTINGEGNLDTEGAQRYSTVTGTDLTYLFVVKNVGNSPLITVTVTDTPNGEGTQVSVTCPQDTLSPDEEMECTGSGVAALGQFDDTATAEGTGTFTNGEALTKRDGSEVPPVTSTSQAGYVATEPGPGPTPTPSPTPPGPTPQPTTSPLPPGPAPLPTTVPNPNNGSGANPANNASDTAQTGNSGVLATTGGSTAMVLIGAGIVMLIAGTVIILAVRTSREN